MNDLAGAREQSQIKKSLLGRVGVGWAQGDQIGLFFAPSDFFAFGLIYQNFINSPDI
jgi:hypothetical protein